MERNTEGAIFPGELPAWQLGSLRDPAGFSLGDLNGRQLFGTEDFLIFNFVKHIHMVRWHHKFNGNELEQTLGDSEDRNLLLCSQGKELDTIEFNEQQQQNTHKKSLPS